MTVENRTPVLLVLSAPSGAGKTTLMRILFGLYRADEGQILVNDFHLDHDIVFREVANLYAFREIYLSDESLEQSRLEFIKKYIDTLPDNYRDLCIQTKLLPLRFDEKQPDKLIIIAADPTARVIPAIARNFGVKKYEVCYCRLKDIQSLMEQVLPLENEFLKLIASDDMQITPDEDDIAVDEEALESEISKSALVNLVEGALLEAVRQGASDVHIIGKEDKRTEFLFRIDGNLKIWHVQENTMPEASVKLNSMKPTTNSKVGFSYRSRFSLDIKDGDVDISNISGNSIAFIPGTPPGTYPGVVKPASAPVAGNSFSTKGRTTLNLPATAALGFAYKLDRLTVEADADWTFWHSWKRLDIDIRDQGALLADINSNRQWKDVVAFRIGAEYRVTDPLALRVGFVYDPTPVPAGTMDAFLPDADRLNYMIGAGYKIGKVTIDLAGMYVDKKDRTVKNMAGTGGATFPSYGSGFNGTWTGDAWLTGLDVAYNF